MKCPHCGQEIGVGTAALAGHAYLLRTQCEKCGKEFLIVDGFPITEEHLWSVGEESPLHSMTSGQNA